MPGAGLLLDPFPDRDYDWRLQVEARFRAIQALPLMIWRDAHDPSAYYGEGDVVTAGGSTFDPTTGTDTFAPAGSAARSITFDDTYVYVASNGTIEQINPDTLAVVDTFSQAGTYSDMLTYGGYLWAVNITDNLVYKIDPATMTTSLTVTFTNLGVDIAEAGGNIFVQEHSGSDRVKKIDPADGSIDATYQAGTSNLLTGRMTSGGGYLWITDDNSNNLYKMDPADGSTDATTALGAGSWNRVSYAAGKVWVCDDVGDFVTKVEPSTGVADSTIDFTAYEIGNTNRGEVVVAADDSTYVWVAVDPAGATVFLLRVTVADDTITEILDSADIPNGTRGDIHYAFCSLWAIDGLLDDLIRIGSCGGRFVCTVAHSGQTPPNTSYWDELP